MVTTRMIIQLKGQWIRS